jgi:hypothetical protein
VEVEGGWEERQNEKKMVGEKNSRTERNETSRNEEEKKKYLTTEGRKIRMRECSTTPSWS